MALRIRKADESFRVEVGGVEGEKPAVLIGRHLGHGALLALKVKATKRGVVDEAKLDALFFEACLIGWENLEDTTGAPLPFSTERAAEVGAALPEDLAQLFGARVRAPAWEFHNAAGNSVGSSPAAPPVTTPSQSSGAASTT